MSQAEQAQKGFKTFILTLSISLIVFSAVYYVITNKSSDITAPDIDSSDNVTSNEDPGAVFGKLANQKINDVQAQAVLAEEDEIDAMLADAGLDPTPTPGSGMTIDQTQEPTQASGTPEGGVVSITLGLITSMAVFLYGMFVISKDPRRMALRSFEERVTRE